MQPEMEPCQQIEIGMHSELTDTNGDVISWNIPDIERVAVDANLVLFNQSQEYDGDDNFIDDDDGDDATTDDGVQDDGD